MSVMNYIQKKKETKERHAQVAIPLDKFLQIKKCLKKDGLTFQSILMAGLNAYLCEREAK